MNQHLQNILSFIQQDKNITAEQKNAITKSLKDADKELEITAFKLDRTEKVKRTTAILLEETIEELEQKRKSVEAQNRELEIETSLERVRTGAMGMNKPDDMLNVCRMISDQLQQLGFKEIRNVQTVIIYELKHEYLNYQYFTPYDKETIERIDYRLHPEVLAFCEKMLQSADAYYTKTFEGDELNLWRDYRKQTNQLPDPKLDETSSSHYYFYSIGSGALGVTTYAPLSEEQINLIKRFRNVFELAYRRFIDIEKAIAQAREAQIELALERVRARTMAMQHSEELQDTSLILFQQLKELGEPAEQCTIGIVKESEGLVEISATLHGNIMQQTFRHKIDEPFVMSKIFRGWKDQQRTLIVELKEEELQKYNQYRNELVGTETFPVKLLPGDRWIIHVAYFSKGMLALSTNEPRPAESLQLLERFAIVFEQTYTRFLDLQKAEAQAREAKIEAALERTRTQSMLMQHSDELNDVSKVFHQQLLNLDIETEFSYLWLPDESNGKHLFWATWAEEKNGETVYFNKAVNYDLDKTEPATATCFSDWESGVPVHVYTLAGDEMKAYFETWKELLSEAKKFKPEFFLQGIYYAEAFMKYGCFGIMIHRNINGEEQDILRRFAVEFERTYTRFLDLKKAEAQSREAQIEASLERVRASSMAMHHSTELTHVLSVLFEQFDVLGICPVYSQMSLLDLDTNTFEFRCTGKLGRRVMAQQTISIDSLQIVKETVEKWKHSEPKSINELHFPTEVIPELFELFQDIRSATPAEAQPNVEDFPDGIYVTEGNFQFGYMGFAHSRKATVEEKDIVLKFATEFGRLYQRFLDLQKAEAQAKEAQIETALEKVRSRSMGMQKSEELKEVIQVVYEQFVHLNIKIEHTGFVIDYKARDDYDIWIADPLGIPSQVIIPYFDCIYYNRFNEAKEKGEDFFVTNLTFEEKNKFYQKLFEYVPGLTEEAKEFYFNCAGLAASTVLLENVALYIENFSGLPFTDEENNTLMRFGKVFQQTYTRFLDLQKAEAQAREAQIETALEKVRSRTMAMQRSDELSETAAVLFNEFKKLGSEDLIQVTIAIYHEAEGTMEFRSTSWAGGGEQTSHPFNLSIEEPTLLHPMFIAWKAQKRSNIVDLTGEKLEGWINYRNANTGVTIKSADTHGRRVVTAAFFSKGHLSISSPVPLQEDTVKTLERFAGVFDSTYTRFNDLQKAEAQAREAQIETALERVRSRTLAMHKSDELAETAAEVFRQLISLGIEPNRLYIGIVKEETGDMEMWATDEDGTQVGKKFMFNKDENASVKKLYDGWATKQKSLIVDMQDKELEDYFHYLSNVMHIPFKSGLTQKRRVQSVAYFSKGFIGMASPDGQGEETIKLLERFAAVFNLTFTRFNDLKIAEAHAQQAEQDLIAIKEAKQKAEEALTELQATQKQLIQSEKMASLGELTAGIAHEIQNPLNFVNNFSEVSKELLDEMKEAIEKGDTEEAKEIMNDVIQNLEKINHHGKRADGIVKGMLQHSRSSSAVKEPTDINKLADEYLRLAYHGLRAKDKSFNATMKTDFDESIGNINIIPQDIGRVILNLITNAFYVVDEKKKQNPNGYEPLVTVRTKNSDDKVLISVNDNGNGIPQKILDKIFQPFYTTKPTGQGTGLGLSLSYDIVKAHGGDLKVETKEGEGAEFIIQLPKDSQ